MNRALRILALIALVSVGLYFACLVVLRPGTFGLGNSPRTWGLQSYEYFLELFLFATQISLASIFADVVVAFIASLQRRQRVWAGALIAAFLVIQFAMYLYYIPAITRALFSGSLNGVTPSFFQLVAGVLAALLVLMYSFQRRQMPVTASDALPEREQARAALPLNGMVRVLAVASVLAYGAYLFLALGVAPAGLQSGMGGAIFVALLLALQLISQFAFVAAVIAIVACFWRRQRVWAFALIGALVLVTCWTPLGFSARYPPFEWYIPIVVTFQGPSGTHFIGVDQILQVVVPALLALVYSFIRPPADAIAVPTPSGMDNPPTSPGADVAEG